MNHKAKAIELLREEHIVPKSHYEKGWLQMNSKPIEVVVRLLEELQSFKERVAELLELKEDAEQEFQSLKDKLTVENIKAQLISCFFKLYPQLNGQDIPLSTVLRSIDSMTTKDLLKLLEPNLEFVAQALIKELEV